MVPFGGQNPATQLFRRRKKGKAAFGGLAGTCFCGQVLERSLK